MAGVETLKFVEGGPSHHHDGRPLCRGGGGIPEAGRAGDYAIYEHFLPFNVARAYGEALGIDTPRIGRSLAT
jgi:hypothetical protein